ncbi:MAG: hemerythrin domain-containing protein [Magnetococcales bacterium]|nr:hemerythrin domain-containing protein [Magnetococcales bacterium]
MSANVVHVISGLLKAQHREILRDFEQLKGLLEGPFNLRCVQRVREILKVLDQRVILHLTQEDQLLYPRLRQEEHVEVQRMAVLFMAEMGGVGQEFNAYIQRWQSEQNLVAQWESFVEDSLQVISRLEWRIHREENELFVLLDALDR